MYCRGFLKILSCYPGVRAEFSVSATRFVRLDTRSLRAFSPLSIYRELKSIFIGRLCENIRGSGGNPFAPTSDDRERRVPFLGRSKRFAVPIRRTFSDFGPQAESRFGTVVGAPNLAYASTAVRVSFGVICRLRKRPTYGVTSVPVDGDKTFNAKKKKPDHKSPRSSLFFPRTGCAAIAIIVLCASTVTVMNAMPSGPPGPFIHPRVGHIIRCHCRRRRTRKLLNNNNNG